MAAALKQNPDIPAATSVLAGPGAPVRIPTGHPEAGDRPDEFPEDFPCASRRQAIAVPEQAGYSIERH